MEDRYNITVENATLPKRVKMLRREVINILKESDDNNEQRQQAQLDMDDLFFLTQLFSYPGDYVAAEPTIERIAETLDKFEEDVFKVPTATYSSLL